MPQTARQLARPGFVELVIRILAETDVPAHLLELEITESTAMQDPENAEKTIGQLRDHGVAIAIDDFGIGQSSLSYLRRFRLSALKIDKSFVDGVPDSENECAITNAIVAMAKSLQIRVVAEGVESQAQADFLAKSGCDEMQGYFFCKPLDTKAMTALLSGAVSPAAVPAKTPG